VFSLRVCIRQVISLWAGAIPLRNVFMSDAPPLSLSEAYLWVNPMHRVDHVFILRVVGGTGRIGCIYVLSKATGLAKAGCNSFRLKLSQTFFLPVLSRARNRDLAA
jgi:hypothetical protein